MSVFHPLMEHTKATSPYEKLTLNQMLDYNLAKRFLKCHLLYRYL